MTSLRHNDSGEDLYLDAAREAILAVGWSRTTLTDVARRAGVSRMTIYRRWPDRQALLGDLMTREWAGKLAEAVVDEGSQLDRLVGLVTRLVRGLREDELFQRIVELDAEVLIPYVLERSGRSQEMLVELMARQIRAGQREGSIRSGGAEVLARSVMLTVHGFVFSAATMGDPRRFDRELAELLDRYLAP